jgi:two-component system sensor histidine kinase QseC
MKAYSIRRRLVNFLLLSLLAIWGAMLALAYVEAREETDERADERLEQMVRTLMRLDLRTPSVQPALAPGTMQDHDKDDDGVSVMVWNADGTLAYASPGAPQISFERREGHSLLTHDDSSWHSYALSSGQNGYQIQVLESSRERDRLAAKLVSRITQTLLLALPVLALLTWVSISRGLKPLTSLTRLVSVRDAATLDPLELTHVPVEVQPLVDSLNRLLTRLSLSFERERAFTADAAHELRTPLAAIKVHAEVAMNATEEEARRQAVSKVIAGVDRATHLVQQLLMLARLEHAGPVARVSVDVGSLAIETVGQFAGNADIAEIELGLSTQPGCAVLADPTGLAVMLGNLLDNAIKHGRPHGHVEVAVERGEREVRISVKDDGAGVAPAERARISQRFYRVPGNGAEGSGLGLAIVSRTAECYGGKLVFEKGLNDGGLGVAVVFPLADEG